MLGFCFCLYTANSKEVNIISPSLKIKIITLFLSMNEHYLALDIEFVESYNSPLGNLNVYASDRGITRIERDENKLTSVKSPHITQAISELDEYFEGTLTTFSVSLDLSSGTPFQQQVWAELLKMPYGKVYSYSDLAISCGDIKKVRAVGKANGANPVPIIVPCHRVIGKDGKMVGYSGGLDMKRFLLKLEKAPVMGELF